MGLRAAGILFLIILSLAGCSASAPTWRNRVIPLVDDLGRLDANKLFPQEYRNLLETFEHGEAVFHVREDDVEADAYYQLAFQKAELLFSELSQLKQRLLEEERQRAAEIALKAEEERLMREAAEAELRLLEQQKLLAAESERQEKLLSAKRVVKESKPQLLVSHTVRRGETLPQIAGRAEIYNDVSLWPLIYRANRDQISDPKRLWPGQILVIPRHFSRDDAMDAKRYSDKR